MPRALARAETCSASDQRCQRRSVEVAGVLGEGGLVGDRLQRVVGRHPPAVLAVREQPQAVAERAEAPDERLAVAGAEVGDGADALALEGADRGLADAPDQPKPASARGSPRVSARPIIAEAARLVELGGDLGEELVVREADRGGDAELGLDPALEAGEEDGGRRAVQALGSREIEEGLVERERLDERA